MASVKVIDVNKHYGPVRAVDNVSFEVEDGEFISLLGPSGCGKTTTLRLIAGLIQPDSGTIEIGGNPVEKVPPYQRNIGMVFQSYALFPHMTVFENVAFGLRMRRISAQESRERVQTALETVQLPGMEARYPRQLSGGQQQRVALARALAIQPTVLLLDEPLSNLDLKLRIQMRLELKQIQRKSGLTTIFVTHDQGEALNLSDRVVVMNAGTVVQVGTPTEIYEQPVNRFVADFMGESNFFNGQIISSQEGRVRVRTETGLTLESVTDRPINDEQLFSIIVRPEKIRIASDDSPSANLLRGSVEHIAYSGASTRYIVQLQSGEKVIVDVPEPSHQLGDQLFITWDPQNSRVLPILNGSS